MAWLSSNSFVAGDPMSHAYLNNLANDIRAWGGNVNGGGYTLSNVSVLSVSSLTGMLLVSGHTSSEVARFQGRTDASNNRNFVSFYSSNTAYWWELSNEDPFGAGSSNGFALSERSASGSAIPRLYIAPGGFIGSGVTQPSRQLHIYGPGQTVPAITDAGAAHGTIYIQDSGAAAGNGGALLFGANQGNFAAIKALLTNGAGNSLGHLAISVRASTGATALAEVVRITEAGRVGIGKAAPGTMLAVVGLPTYADNTAATGGGLTAGDFYRTAAGLVGVVF